MCDRNIQVREVFYVKRLSSICVQTVAILLVSSCLAFGQSPTGEIHLQVNDPSGAGMQVSGRLQGPGTDRPFQTDAQGSITLSNLPDGRYLLEVSKDGFVTQPVRINVESRTASSRTITMALGTASTTVDVVATTPLSAGNLSLQETPAPVQTATQQDVENRRPRFVRPPEPQAERRQC